ncbi:MAG: iron chelate uptake ABC transporter family permease subunit, partial [Ilumatobacteraceae bacterium]
MTGAADPRAGLSPAPSRTRWWWLPIATVVLMIAIALGAMIGPAGGISSANWNIVWNIRLPRVALAGLVGSMLSLAGASYQGVFRNPLVDPYLLGAAAGAGLGASLVFIYGRVSTSGWLVDPLPLAAFVGALLAVLVTYTVGASFGGSSLSL